MLVIAILIVVLTLREKSFLVILLILLVTRVMLPCLFKVLLICQLLLILSRMFTIILLRDLLLRVRPLRLSSCLIIPSITLILLLIITYTSLPTLSILLSIVFLIVNADFLDLIVLRLLSSTTVSLRIRIVIQRCRFFVT